MRRAAAQLLIQLAAAQWYISGCATTGIKHPLILQPIPCFSKRTAHFITTLQPCTAASTAFSNAPLSLVSPAAVESILAEDWAHTMADIPSYTIYLLNPKAAQPYAYAYDPE